jgi:hypothetical protein
MIDNRFLLQDRIKLKIIMMKIPLGIHSYKSSRDAHIVYTYCKDYLVLLDLHLSSNDFSNFSDYKLHMKIKELIYDF